MAKKTMVFIIIATVIVGFMLVISSDNVEAAKKGREYRLDRKYDLTDSQIKEVLQAGWRLGGVYRDCGTEFGEVQVTANVPGGMQPLYEKLLESTKQEMLDLLKKTNTLPKSQEILDKIVTGKDKLTNYGSISQYKKLQDRFDKINSVLAEIKTNPQAGTASVDDLVATLQEFVKSGTSSTVNEARLAVQALGTIIEKNPDKIIDPSKDVDDNMATLENIRKNIMGSLKKAEKLGSGCKMVYLFYRK